MADIDRFDFTNPPPGHFLDEFDKAMVRQGHGKPRTIAAARARWKEKRDPPGMWVGERVLHQGRIAETVHAYGVGETMVDWFIGDAAAEMARAAAWTHYDRRLALIADLEGVGITLDMWPAALLWTGGDCMACEDWLKRGPAWDPNDFPTVLRALAQENRPRG